MPFFSVIIPSYNRATILPRAISSVVAQSFLDWELLIVDDGSTDTTYASISSFLEDERIQYYKQENKGVCAARNHGINNVKGEFICFLDSDDEVQITWLEDFYQAVLKQPYDVVFCNATLHDLDGSQTIVKANFPFHKSKYDANGIYLAGIFTIKKTFLTEAGVFDENIKFGEFTELSIRIRQHQPNVYFNEKNNLIYYITTLGGGKKNNNKIASNLYLLQKHAWFFNTFPNVKRLYLQNIAVAYARIKEWKSCQYYFWKAYMVQPWKFKTLLRWVISLFPFIAVKLWK
jgi:glycosyltransferase involved in cell wall biosynthesis